MMSGDQLVVDQGLAAEQRPRGEVGGVETVPAGGFGAGLLLVIFVRHDAGERRVQRFEPVGGFWYGREVLGDARFHPREMALAKTRSSSALRGDPELLVRSQRRVEISLRAAELQLRADLGHVLGQHGDLGHVVRWISSGVVSRVVCRRTAYS